MDRGFYSKENIDALYQNHLKFLMATKVSLKYVQEELSKVRVNIRTRANYNASYQLYSHTATIDWEYSQKRPYKGNTIEWKRRMYLHLYFSGEKALEHENCFPGTAKRNTKSSTLNTSKSLQRQSAGQK